MPDAGHDVSFVDIAGDIVEVLDIVNHHRHLGKHLSLRLDGRSQVEVKHRIHQAWGAFRKHRMILLNHDIALPLRLKFFDASISPCILFAMSILPLSKTQIESICVVQRKMLRRIVRWRRIGDEPWRDTMTRMRERVSRAIDLHHIDD